MNIGYVQFAPVLGNSTATVQALERLIGGIEQVDVLVLPELCNSGYNFASREHAWQTSEKITDSAFVHLLAAFCARKKCYVVSGFNERYRDRLYNSAILLGPKGFLGKYHKLHLFMKEKDFFAPGEDEPIVFDIGGCKLGMLLCFDWIFPEVWRILALKGADLICHPSNLVLPGLAQKAIPVYATINRTYVVTANRIGREGDLTFTGQSLIADPRGKILIQATSSKEAVGLAVMDVTLARDKMITPRNDLFKDRRPELYDRLTATRKRYKTIPD